ncbi:MAG: hypothetical protein J5606_08660, partial [Bacteroidales bacterium]|nr:hypothetical protein [Bacteroidales bacterium]
GASSVFRTAIRQALIEYRPILDDFLKKKREAEESKKSTPFVLKTKYAYTDDYKTFEPSTLSYVQPFRLPETYKGRDNETEFIQFLEQQVDSIEWWFKNGTGKEALGFKYTDSLENIEKTFYPDWLIKFKGNRIGIFDTKGGITAKSPETKDKAECLAKRINELNQKSQFTYVGGIVIKKANSWYYNDNQIYDYSNPTDWKEMINLF